MSKDKNKFLAKYIFEVKLNEKNLFFIDKKGEILDSIIKNYKDLTQFALSENLNRIDLKNDNKDKSVVISWENFGFQLDLIEDDFNFEKFKLFFDSFIKLLKSIDDVYTRDVKNLFRIGIRAVVVYCPHNKKTPELQNVYKTKFFNGFSSFEKIFNFNLSDFGVFAIEMVNPEDTKNKLKIDTGIISGKKDVSILLGNSYINKIDKGFYLNMDFSNELPIFDTDKISYIDKVFNDNIKKMIDGFNNFKNIIDE
ncbi:MAG: hypothetical protein QMB51_02305 [Patescibacteria group bacterium]